MKCVEKLIFFFFVRLSKHRLERVRLDISAESQGECYKGFPASYWCWARSLPHSLTKLNEAEEVAAMQIFKVRHTYLFVCYLIEKFNITFKFNIFYFLFKYLGRIIFATDKRNIIIVDNK